MVPTDIRRRGRVRTSARFYEQKYVRLVEARRRPLVAGFLDVAGGELFWGTSFVRPTVMKLTYDGRYLQFPVRRERV